MIEEKSGRYATESRFHIMGYQMETEVRKQAASAANAEDREKGREMVRDTEVNRAELERARTELLTIRSQLTLQASELEKCRVEVAEMRAGKGRYNDLFYSAPIGYLLVDKLQQIISVNSKAAELLGVTSSSLAQTLLPLYVVPDCRKALALKIERACRGEAGDITVRMLCGNRTVSASLKIDPVKDLKHTGFICQISIVTLSENRASETQLKNAKDYLQHLATHDALTDLPNRRDFYDSLEEALSWARRSACRVAIMMLDLDRFKFINDSLGHEVGDELLIAVAQRLKDKVFTGDTVSRLGGDEFSVVLRNIDNQSAVDDICESIRHVMSVPFKLKKQEVSISASIGVCIYPVDSVQRKELLKFADAALYKAKSRGGNCVQNFSNSLHHKMKRRVQMESDLRTGILGDSFDTWFQPIHTLDSGSIVGIEALVRWQHPRRGLVSPADFIGLAEECGVIEQLGQIVLEQACTKLVSLHSHGYDTLRLAINISSQQLERENLSKHIDDVLKKSGLDPKFLEFEVTEAVLFNDTSASQQCLGELSSIGVKLVVDDFGTGYSSFNKLRRLPVSKIKIDQSFVNGVPFDPEACSIVKAIVSIARDLGIEVVSEGVETPEQLKYLTSIGCDLAQGYLLSNPVCANAIEGILVNHVPLQLAGEQ